MLALWSTKFRVGVVVSNLGFGLDFQGSGLFGNLNHPYLFKASITGRA